MNDNDAFDDRPPSGAEQALLDDLRDALSVDDLAVPPHLLAGAREAFAWRRMDAALAELVAFAPPAGVRGASDHSTFAFTSSDGRRVDVELQPTGHRVVAVGQLSPPTPSVAAWEARDRRGAPVDLGDEGYFELDDVPRGPLRIVVTPHTGQPLHTDWFVA